VLKSIKKFEVKNILNDAKKLSNIDIADQIGEIIPNVEKGVNKY
jgi:hypothetical protein